MKTFGLIALIVACSFASVPAQIPAQLLQLLPSTQNRDVDDAAVLTRYRKALLADFEQLLDEPDAYVRRVKIECRQFPEGDLFPYLLPAYAYISLAQRGEVEATRAQHRIAQLIELARPAVVARLKPPAGNLMNLHDYRSNATYLGQFTLALCAYRLVGGDNRYDAERSHLAELLRDALQQAHGASLNSFPGLNWTFDTVPVLLALHYDDQLTGSSQSQSLIAQHWQWLDAHCLDPQTQLPRSRPSAAAPPRGCELSWRIALLAQLDADRARQRYGRYTAAMWLDRGSIVGFREYPANTTGATDADSGPVLADVGGTASILGIATTIAMNDRPRLHRLCQQLDAMPQLVPLTVLPGNPPRIAGMIPYDKQYHTGFLYGDVTLFYAVTWNDWQFQQ